MVSSVTDFFINFVSGLSSVWTWLITPNWTISGTQYAPLALLGGGAVILLLGIGIAKIIIS